MHDHNCGLKCYRGEIFREVRLYGEMHRFLPVLAHARGFRVGEVPVGASSAAARSFKVRHARIVKGFLDLVTVSFLTRYGQRPLHLLGSVGLACLGLGGLGMIAVVAAHLIFGEPSAAAGGGLFSIIGLLASLGIMICGSQLFGLGLLAEWIVAYQGRERDVYAIAEETARSDDVAGVEKGRGGSMNASAAKPVGPNEPGGPAAALSAAHRQLAARDRRRRLAAKRVLVVDRAGCGRHAGTDFGRRLGQHAQFGGVPEKTGAGRLAQSRRS